MTRMTVWDPFREMARLSEDMSRLVGELVGERRGRETLRGAWVPPVDILETADAIRIDVELPGLAAGDVEITVENGVLTVRGERAFRDAGEGETYHRVERAYGEFERSFQLPRSVDPERIRARFEAGVLRLELPKREESRPRSIKVEVK